MNFKPITAIKNAWATNTTIRQLNRQHELNRGVLRTDQDIERLRKIRHDGIFEYHRPVDGNLREEIDVIMNWGPQYFSKAGFIMPGETTFMQIDDVLIKEVDIAIHFLWKFFKQSMKAYRYHSGEVSAACEEYCELTKQGSCISNLAMIIAGSLSGAIVRKAKMGRYGWFLLEPVDPAMLRIATKGYLRKM